MRKIKNPKIGEYVLLSRWSDHDVYDPFEIGFLTQIRITKQTTYYSIGEREFKNCFRLTPKEGKEILSLARSLNT